MRLADRLLGLLRTFGAIRSLGLADCLVLGGSIALAVGLTALFGWPVALVVLGVLSLAGGVVIARAENAKVARR